MCMDAILYQVIFLLCVLLVVLKIKENSALDAVVGQVSTSDPDNIKSIRQTFTYTLKDSAGGLFKLVGSKLQVSGLEQCVMQYNLTKVHSPFEARKFS